MSEGSYQFKPDHEEYVSLCQGCGAPCFVRKDKQIADCCHGKFATNVKFVCVDRVARAARASGGDDGFFNNLMTNLLGNVISNPATVIKIAKVAAATGLVAKAGHFALTDPRARALLTSMANAAGVPHLGDGVTALLEHISGDTGQPDPRDIAPAPRRRSKAKKAEGDGSVPLPSTRRRSTRRRVVNPGS